jgi:hypothetical protein
MPYTRQLVYSLTNLDLSHSAISRDQVDRWKQGLAELKSQGTVAVPAIREFLESNQELNFAAVNGGELLGESSLRSALLNVLAQIGGPEGSAVMLQTLQTTTLPSEIAQIAQYLEQQAPGQYRQETLNAVNEVLAMSSKGELPGLDVGALFKVLQSYGDGATASAIGRLEAPWKYYATMSLAGLQGGEGVPVLIGELRDASAGGKRDFAYQMLAQVACQYPEAGTALLEQARANQIPDVTWRKLATGLAGDQYQIGAPPSAGGPDTPPLSGLKTYHVESGNQNFYSLPLAPDGQVQQRLALIDQLLSATGNPVAVTALQSARVTLSNLLPK